MHVEELPQSLYVVKSPNLQEDRGTELCVAGGGTSWSPAFRCTLYSFQYTTILDNSTRFPGRENTEGIDHCERGLSRGQCILRRSRNRTATTTLWIFRCIISQMVIRGITNGRTMTTVEFIIYGPLPSRGWVWVMTGRDTEDLIAGPATVRLLIIGEYSGAPSSVVECKF